MLSIDKNIYNYYNNNNLNKNSKFSNQIIYVYINETFKLKNSKIKKSIQFKFKLT